MNTVVPLPYLRGYPAHTLAQVQALLERGESGAWLRGKYPQAHGLRTDSALYSYVLELKNRHLRGAESVSRVRYDSKLQLVQNALGTHTNVARVQGSRLKAKREIRIAALFRDAPAPFLQMIVAHELAHLRQRAHDKAFYQLCCHLDPTYHQLEFEVRLYLTHLDAGGARLWDSEAAPAVPAESVNAGATA